MGIILKYAQKAVAMWTFYYLFILLQINDSVLGRIIAATIVVITTVLCGRPWRYSLEMIHHILFENITSEDVTAIHQDIKDIQRFYKRIVKVKNLRVMDSLLSK